MTVHNLTELKKAKIYVKELEKALKIINATEASLKNYSKYRPIQYILTTIRDEKPILEGHLERAKLILETKGERGV